MLVFLVIRARAHPARLSTPCACTQAVQLVQILTGINAIVSFSGTMFAQLGTSGITSAVLPFVANLAANMIGAFGLVDRLGRRPVLICGMTGKALTLLASPNPNPNPNPNPHPNPHPHPHPNP